RHIVFLAAGLERVGPGQMSHGNMSRKRSGRNPANHVQSARFGQSGKWRTFDRRAISGERPRAFRAEHGAHDRAGRQGGLRLGRAYLAPPRWPADLVAHAEGLDEHPRHKASFYVRQVSNAIAPSNFILTNPELFRETVASNGENLVRGMKMLAEDIAAGRGDLRLR